jgi:Mg-chelatase subunit ChlI
MKTSTFRGRQTVTIHSPRAQSVADVVHRQQRDREPPTPPGPDPQAQRRQSRRGREHQHQRHAKVSPYAEAS